jgi:hypothetical protein
MYKVPIPNFRTIFFYLKTVQGKKKFFTRFLHVAVGDKVIIHAPLIPRSNGKGKVLLGVDYDDPSYVTLKVSWVRVITARCFLMLDPSGRLLM